jgi:hypothetical protein
MAGKFVFRICGRWELYFLASGGHVLAACQPVDVPDRCPCEARVLVYH